MNSPKKFYRFAIFYLTLFFSVFLASNGSPSSEEVSLIEKLIQLPDVWIRTIRAQDHFKEAYEIRLLQPLDHNRPEGKKFQQRIFISHVDFSSPVVFETEGYSVEKNTTKELSSILKCNQIIVEHRFFGTSVPDSMDWKYLNIEQAAADHHRIVMLFKSIYPGKWISSGWSKGGQTAMYHRRFYPEDVDVTVAYDSPLNLSLEDKRIDAFFDTVATKDQRSRLIRFQRLILQRKDRVIPLFRDYAWNSGLEFSIGLEKALEYCVLEYTFSFWQYHKIDPMTVPGTEATSEELFNHLKRVVHLPSYSDRAMDSPSMYQFATELGYYGYVKRYVRDLLSCDYYPNWIFAPQNTDLTYHPEKMQDIERWIQNHGERMLFIYGSRDPWSAPQVRLNGNKNCLKMILRGGNHYTFIRSFSDKQQQKIIQTLERWLDLKISN